jgi:hypothetical protein
MDMEPQQQHAILLHVFRGRENRYGYGKGFLHLDKIFKRECVIPRVPCFFQNFSYHLLQDVNMICVKLILHNSV